MDNFDKYVDNGIINKSKLKGKTKLFSGAEPPKSSANIPGQTEGEPIRHKITHAAIEDRRKEAGLPPIEKLPTDIKKDFTEAADEFKDSHNSMH